MGGTVQGQPKNGSLKTGNYLIACLVRGEDRAVIENLTTRQLIVVSLPMLHLLARVARGDSAVLERIPDEVMSGLRAGGFVLPTDACEAELIRMHEMQSRFGAGEVMELWIALTYDCNMACAYCTQNWMRSNETMSTEVADALLSYLEGIMPSKRCIRVCWYGGEPLLAKDMILYITSKLTAIASARGTALQHRIITNGTLLDDAVVAFLRELNVYSVQITLDTTQEFHDKYRRYQDDGPTWTDIYTKVKRHCTQIPIVLRANLTAESARVVKDWIVTLQADGVLEHVHLAPCMASCFEGYDYVDENTFPRNLEVANSAYEDLLLELMSDPSLSEESKARWMSVIIPTNYMPCQAALPGSFVIGPRGELYKCAVGLGDPQLEVGHIMNRGPLDPVREARYVGFDPTADPICAECLVMPACGGGCLVSRVKGAAPSMTCVLSAPRWYKTMRLRLEREHAISVRELDMVNIYACPRRLGTTVLSPYKELPM